MKSILQDRESGCLFCGNPNTEEHHVYGGANRKNSTAYQIKRGEPVEVPLSVAEVLRNSDRQIMVAMQRQEEMASKNYGEM